MMDNKDFTLPEEENPEVAPENSEQEEPEIRGGIVPKKDKAGFYSFKNSCSYTVLHSLK